MKPLVTVLVTAYNAERFVVEAIESIRNQTYKNLEIIVVNDGSKDGTLQILRECARKDTRIKIVAGKRNLGPSLASNVGMKYARGKYVARMDADDIATPERIEKQVSFLRDNPDVVLVGGQCELIDEQGVTIGFKQFPIEHKDIYESLFRINPIQHPSCMINRKLVPKSHRYYHNHFILAHDLELEFELAKYGKLANLKDVVLKYRQYPNSLSLRDPKETFEATVYIRQKALKKYGYKPTLTGLVTDLLQRVVVTMLPSKAIYPSFAIMRFGFRGYLKNMVRSRNSRFQTLRPAYAFLRLAVATIISRYYTGR